MVLFIIFVGVFLRSCFRAVKKSTAARSTDTSTSATDKFRSEQTNVRAAAAYGATTGGAHAYDPEDGLDEMRA